MADHPLRSWPPTLNERQLEEITKLATTYALAKGFAYLPIQSSDQVPNSDITPHSAIHAPFTLFPTPFPRALFERALRIQRAYSVLYSRIALDVPFLDRVMGAVEGVGKVDEFMGTLWKGWKALRDEGSLPQVYHLGLFRSDYMLHQESSASQTFAIKQVEFNTISVSFGALSEKVAALHRYLCKATGYYGTAECLQASNMPPNDTVKGLAQGLLAAHRRYGTARSSILFVVQGGERNVFDQRWLEYELTENHGIHVVRQTFHELFSSISISPSGTLTLNLPTYTTPIEISVVYYRAGYGPAEYPTTQHYDMRFQLERSTAIKCPTIPLQLAGGKKIQQVLTDPGILEMFLQDPTRWNRHGGDPGQQQEFSDHDLAELRDTWVDMWGLDQPTGIARARENAHSLVLKPQREGGGNNVYKAKIPPFLDALPEKEREAWIAMELIRYPSGVKNWLAKSGEGRAVEKEVVNELGVFGWALFKDDEPMKEQGAGWLVRTKGNDSDEGGVAVGFSVLDSLVLVS
ncbi:hypothetical protein FRB94_003870 [Tulasnella sp. JGI-2019a]|nr:hypothetical protein FRB93_013174 [Tulasnella sp. JGI-2019a]KAG9002459.1 hypothetical protein FRB94_003870 [Tulasnella sp. JGI-2019a]